MRTFAAGKTPDAHETAALQRPGRKALVPIKRVKDHRRQLGPTIELCGQLFSRVALMDDKREGSSNGELDLPLERALLLIEGRARASEVEPRLAYGKRAQREEPLSKCIRLRCAEGCRVLGVNPRRHLDIRMCVTKCNRRFPNIWPIRDIQEALHSGRPRTFQNLWTVGVKRRVVEVRMGVKDWRQGFAHLTVTLFARFRGRSGSLPRVSAA
ncbi:MAG: hypothetical protein M3Z20_09795 [Chloroflexota bacterium]|nr:hypothetical protein [Chloroflexota bacterium]